MSIASSLRDSQNFFMQSLHLYTSSWYSMFINGDIVDTENSYGICFLAFVENEIWRLF